MIDKFSVADHTFAMRTLTLLSVDEILLPRYENWSDFRSLFLRGSRRNQCLLLLVAVYAIGIRLGQVHTLEALEHLYSLHL